MKTGIAFIPFLLAAVCVAGMYSKENKLVAVPQPTQSFVPWMLEDEKQPENYDLLCDEEFSQEVEQEEEPAVVYSFKFPNEKELRLIGRMAQGIARWKSSGWWQCGVLITSKETIKDTAVFYAYLVVKSAKDVSGDDWKLNPWGLLGTVRNESRFDRCALGLNPRKKAYSLKVLKPRKTCISHSAREIVAAVESPKLQKYFTRSGVDIGLSQMLSRHYQAPFNYAKMIEPDYGMSEAARWMRHLGWAYKTKRPWRYWRGREVGWYDTKIVRAAHLTGAKDSDIREYRPRIK